jgi:hypothetical protein
MQINLNRWIWSELHWIISSQAIIYDTIKAGLTVASSNFFLTVCISETFQMKPNWKFAIIIVISRGFYDPRFSLESKKNKNMNTHPDYRCFCRTFLLGIELQLELAAISEVSRSVKQNSALEFWIFDRWKGPVFQKKIMFNIRLTQGYYWKKDSTLFNSERPIRTM